MGIAEIGSGQLVISSHLIIYGDAANSDFTQQVREEIETMWNEPQAQITVDRTPLQVLFRITAELKKDLTELEVLQNVDPRNNYFRIEEFVYGNISFVDGLGCNTGYFKAGNLLQGWTTAAHEYGHTLGLDHPANLDYRGRGTPRIMYPRGTLVDAAFQYDSTRPAGVTGGTMHPQYRKVQREDIEDLKLHKLFFKNGKAIVGEFTNIYHWKHEEGRQEDFIRPPIVG